MKSFLLITLTVILFFIHLFIPRLSLFSTPDFGESDIWQLNLPLKYFLSTSLKSGDWPLWNPYIGNGFPTLAEGQTGTFYIVNLLLFRFLPFVIAYNIGYVTIFLTSALGTYLYCRNMRRTRIASVFASIIFSFSGYFIAHISHYNLIQTSSLLPWMFYAAEKFFTSLHRKFLWGAVFSLVLSQQIFTGFPQITMITLIGITLYSFYHLFTNKHTKKTQVSFIFYFLLFILLGFAASSIQLLPQKEFLDTSTRSGGFGSVTATYFSYPFKHLVTMISPYALGDPRIGTYPEFTKNDGSIFWENTAFIGWLPLIFAFISIKLLTKSRKIQFYWILVIVSFLLMTGKYSPLYFVYPFPPLSYFRVPSRFIILFVWSLVILSSFGLDHLDIYKQQFSRLIKKLLKGIILTNHAFISIKVALIGSAFLQLFAFSYFYNPVLSANRVMKAPEVVKYVDTHNEYKYYSYGLTDSWNKIFNTKGWKNISQYLYYKNALLANQNSIYQLPSLNLYRAQTTRRYDALINYFNLTSNNPDSYETSASVLFINLLRLYGVKFLITQFDISTSNSISLTALLPPSYKTPTIKIYTIKDPLPSVYVVQDLKNITYVPEFFAALSQNNALSANTAYIEKPITLYHSDNSHPLEYKITSRSFSPSRITIHARVNKNAILIINSSYYSGWYASDNGRAASLFPVNLNQTGLIIRKGDNDIVLQYNPQTFIMGKKITLGSMALLLITIMYTSVKKISFRPTSTVDF